MKQKTFAAMLILTILTAFTAAYAECPDLIIDSREELYAFAESVNSGNSYKGMNVVLNADIYLNDSLFDSDGALSAGNAAQWTPIGTEQNQFKGNFDGNGNSVWGIYVNKDENYGGLFGVISNASVKNVCVRDSYVSTAAHSGAVVGYAREYSVVAFCHNYGSKIYTNDRSGGVVGWTDNSDVYNCTNTGYIFSDRCSGGIVGDVYVNGKIYNCENAGIVDGYQLLGGISGGSTTADIRNCLNVGEIKSGYHIAGGGGTRFIENCYAYKTGEFNSYIDGEANIFDTPSAVLSTSISIDGQNYTKVVDALNAYKATISAPVRLADWSQQSEAFPTLGGVVEKPSETIISGYDAETCSATIYTATDGDYVVIFADYDENGRLRGLDLVEDTFKAGAYSEILQKDASFVLCTGDKIMLWENITNLAPVCEEYVIE